MRLRHVLRIIRQVRKDDGHWKDLYSYARLLGWLYQQIRTAAGARVVVDSSKNPAGAAMLPIVPGISAVLVHLVRDPRAVAFSMQRQRPLPEFGGKEEMGRVHPVRSSVQWFASNLISEAVRSRAPVPSVFLRYEELVRNPKDAVRKVLTAVGESADMDFITSSGLHLGMNHTVGGNPRRFSTGIVEVRPDDEWLARQRPLDRWMATIPALPLMSRYGYRLSANRGIR